MSVESIKIPSERVPPVAADTASGSKSVAAVLFFLCAICAIAMMGVLFDNKEGSSKDSAEAAGGVIGALLFAGIPGIYAYRAARNASRATRAGSVAKNDPSYTFRLSGKFVIATDGPGVPHPELSFKVNSKIRTMLLALPQAELVNRS